MIEVWENKKVNEENVTIMNEWVKVFGDSYLDDALTYIKKNLPEGEFDFDGEFFGSKTQPRHKFRIMEVQG